MSTKSFLITVLIIFGSFIIKVNAISTPTWLKPYIPVRGSTLEGEIKCYSLPYSGIGFVSHALTYWALYWLWKGRKPYWPWRKLSCGRLDIVFSVIQKITTVSFAAFTIATCKNRWQFITIAIWKLMLSPEVVVWGFRAPL